MTLSIETVYKILSKMALAIAALYRITLSIIKFRISMYKGIRYSNEMIFSITTISIMILSLTNSA